MKITAKIRLLFASGLTLVLLGVFNNCGTKGTTGNPMVSVRFDNYVSSKPTPEKTPATSAFTPMSVQMTKMCFKRLRFKASASGNDEDNIDLNLGEVTLAPGGMDLTAVRIAAGTYTRVEFDLDDECGNGSSLAVQNSNGTFSTNDHITIRFDGTFTVLDADIDLNLNIQSIISALNLVTSNSQVRNQGESTSGSF